MSDEGRYYRSGCSLLAILLLAILAILAVLGLLVFSKSGTTTTGQPPSPPTTSSSPTPDPRERQKQIDEQRSMLREGKIAVEAPTTMTVQTVTTVTVTVADNSPPSDFPSSGPTVTVAPALVGSDVKADLTGEGFTITRVGGDDGSRTLANGRSAKWQWQVTPQISGKRQLFVSLYVRVDGEDGAPVDVRTYQQDVNVQVNTPYAIGEFFKTWLPVTGLTVPIIIGALWALFRKRPSMTSSPPPQPGPSPTPTPGPSPPDTTPPAPWGRPPPGYL
jgi:hypothetical protein